MERKRKWFGGTALALALVTLCGGAVAASPDPDRLRAAMIYNLTKFVRWPDDIVAGESVVRLCVVGGDSISGSVAGHLRSVENKQVNGRRIVVERLDTPAAGCHVLILGTNAINVEPTPGTLTIGQNVEFLTGGGMIAIDVEKNRMVFDVNLSLVKSQNLEISAELLSLARSVR